MLQILKSGVSNATVQKDNAILGAMEVKGGAEIARR